MIDLSIIPLNLKDNTNNDAVCIFVWIANVIINPL